jgi:putative solute:sodium symporter small subunit
MPPSLDRHQYWLRQRRRILVLLAVWAFVGFGLSIFGVEALNGFSLGGVPLGFWMAQQGSIFVFIVLILIYAVASDRADREAGLQESSAPQPAHPDAH